MKWLLCTAAEFVHNHLARNHLPHIVAYDYCYTVFLAQQTFYNVVPVCWIRLALTNHF